MPEYSNIFISACDFTVNLGNNIISECFIEDVGYAFHTFGYVSSYDAGHRQNNFIIVHGQGIDYSTDTARLSMPEHDANIAADTSPEIIKPDPYQDDHGLEVFTLEQFLEENRGKSYFEIINQRPKRDGMPGGPKMRMVRNPNDDKIMDMRHVMVVGYGAAALTGSNYITGNIIGLGIEIVQWFGPWFGKDSRGSAFDKQDFYSNNIGANFCSYYLPYRYLFSDDWTTSFVNWMKK